MAFRLRTIEFTATGREIVRDRALAGSEIAIGRAAQSAVHLPDLAVEPRHATVSSRDGIHVDVRAAGTLGFTVDGSETTQATIDSEAGAELGFGTYRITVSSEAGDVLLTVRRAEQSATRSGDIERKRGFSLAGVLPSKRAMSWGQAAAILLLFLIVPALSHMVHDPADRDGTVIADSSWSPGALSLAHHALEDRCEACHVDAFVSVRNRTCLSCHEHVHDHADPAKLAAARAGRPLGRKFLSAVARAFGKEGPGSCADCHVEHEGEAPMATPTQHFCSDCHGALRQNLPGTRLGDASDFGKLHPQFTPTVVVDPASRRTVAISLDRRPREDSGLKFPHRLHLDPRGGVARMAANIGGERGYGKGGLQCKDCHHPTEDGIRFEAIRMERDCEACHSLAYEKVGGIFRKLHHGDVDQLIADLAATDLARPPLSPRKRPGDYAAGGPYHFNFSAPVWKGLQVQTALSDEGICGECHRPMTRGDGRPGVMPVTLVTRYFRHGWFDHGSHGQERCASCHAAGSSQSASDLLLPGIGKCRTCHQGEDADKAKVPSGCAMCHGYHATAQGSREDGMGDRRKAS